MTDERPTEPTPLTNPADQPPPLTPPEPTEPVAGWQAPSDQQAPPATAWQPPSAAPAPPPAVAWQAPAAPVAVATARSGWAAAAGIVMIVLAILGAFVGLLVIVGGALASSYFDFSTVPQLGTNGGNVVSTIATIVGVIVIAYSLVYLIGGIGVLRSRDWGRVTGIVVGVLSALFWLASVGGAGSAAAQSNGGNVAFPLVLLLVHAYIVVALIAAWKTRRA